MSLSDYPVWAAILDHLTAQFRTEPEICEANEHGAFAVYYLMRRMAKPTYSPGSVLVRLNTKLRLECDVDPVDGCIPAISGEIDLNQPEFLRQVDQLVAEIKRAVAIRLDPWRYNNLLPALRLPPVAREAQPTAKEPPTARVQRKAFRWPPRR